MREPVRNAIAAAGVARVSASFTMPEIADAMGEALNMLGGAIKRRFNSPDLELGLPLFVVGHVQATSPSSRCRPISARSRCTRS